MKRGIGRVLMTQKTVARLSDTTHLYDVSKDFNISDHFRLREFCCPCGNCRTAIIDLRLVELLEKLRDILKKPLIISSGYRCAGYQQKLRERGYETALGISAHEMGKAADIKCLFVGADELARVCEVAGFPSIGQGDTFVHVDIRGLDDGRQRRWTYRGVKLGNG